MAWQGSYWQSNSTVPGRLQITIPITEPSKAGYSPPSAPAELALQQQSERQAL
jgi:hypothetical protein